MSLEARITARIEEFERNVAAAERRVDQMAKRVNSSGSRMKDVFKGVFGANIVEDFARRGIRAVTDFAVKAVDLADTAKGVVPAFERLGDPSLLRSLVDATGGAVSNLELMQRAVTASNLGIPIAEMSNLLEFAAIRARETGESVDFLVNSIVTGIGRKSTLVLDNLGLSATRVRDALNGASLEASSVADVAAAVGRIAVEEMDKAGVSIKDVASETERLTAKFDDLALTVGEKFAPAVDKAKGEVTDFISDIEVLVDSLPAVTGFFEGFKAALITITLPLIVAREAIGFIADKIRETKKEITPGNTPFADLIPDDILVQSGKFLSDLIAIELTAVRLARIRAITEDTVNKKAIADAAAEAERLARALQSAQSQITTEQLADAAVLEQAMLQKAQGDVIRGFSLTDKAKDQEIFNLSQSGLPEAETAMDALVDKQNELTAGQAIMAQGYASAFGAITDSIAQANLSLEGFAQTVLNVAQQVINAALAKAIAEAIAGEAHKGLFGLITAGIAVAGIRALFSSSVPKLAVGTDRVSGDGLAMLHKGEQVVPAAEVDGGGFSGGTRQIKIVSDGLEFDATNFILKIRQAEEILDRVR